MTYFIILVIVAGVAATIHALVRDARGPRPAPRSHRIDGDFVPPSARLSR